MTEEQTKYWRPSWLNYWKSFALAVLILIITSVVIYFVSSMAILVWVSLGIGLFAALAPITLAVIDRLRRLYMLDPDGHVIERYGIIAKQTDEVRVQDIRLLRVNQTLVQRIFNLGEVEIATAGHSEVEIHMIGIYNPEVVKEAIRELQGELDKDDTKPTDE